MHVVFSVFPPFFLAIIQLSICGNHSCEKGYVKANVSSAEVSPKSFTVERNMAPEERAV